MSILLYQLFLWLYSAAIGLAAATGNRKAKLWIGGRKDWRNNLRKKIMALPPGNRIWLHAASLGEFEQGRPIIEALKEWNQNCWIILTFFSPSGYEIRKDYELADVSCYLPLDGKQAARDFVSMVQPSVALFVKYEFWYWYLNALKENGVPTALVSAAFRKGQPFFKWYGGLFRKMLSSYAMIFVQDRISSDLLAAAGFKENVRLTGDTRYDRVAAIAKAAKNFPLIEAFGKGRKLIVAGSTWPADEAVLKKALGALPEDWKLVLAPHEIDTNHLQAIDELFGSDAIRDSAFTENSFGHRVLVIDNIGMLSSLYRYGEVAFIGGGFNRGGIHNVLEPAVFGLPVVFGPVYEKFVEAVMLVDSGMAFAVQNAGAAAIALQQLCSDDVRRAALQAEIKAFVQSRTGATDIVVEWVYLILRQSEDCKPDGCAV